MRVRMVWSGATGAAAPRALATLCDALASWNTFLLERDRSLPDLYASGVVFQREDYDGPHPEDWRDVTEVLRRGGGDCEDLAAYRVADLRRSGDRADLIFIEIPRDGGRMFHILVKRQYRTGGIFYEDPARELGMLRP